MKPPIFISGLGDTLIFRSVSHAESYLEPQEIKTGQFRAYDSEGMTLHLGLKQGGRYVHIEAGSHEKAEPEILANILRNYLPYIPSESGKDFRDLTLSQLVEIASNYYDC